MALIEDCAHTLGTSWDGTKSGRFSAIGCFSLQAYKHINAGEGGILTTDDECWIHFAICVSRSALLQTTANQLPKLSAMRYIRLLPHADGWRDTV